MPPRPIHKSKTLWAGILVITFLVWAWWDSTQASSFLNLKGCTFQNAGAGIFLTDRGKTSPPASAKTWGRTNYRDATHPWALARFESPAIFHFDQDASQSKRPLNASDPHFLGLRILGLTDSRAIYIPHWLIILLFLIPWLALLIWRHRRINQLHRQGPLSKRSGE